eukprot:8925195-Alexandrium_andersonii.AAC.1
MSASLVGSEMCIRDRQKKPRNGKRNPAIPRTNNGACPRWEYTAIMLDCAKARSPHSHSKT